MSISRTVYPVVTLLLLSPTIAELLSASSTPVEYFEPITLIFFIGLYGMGSVLIRDLVYFWGKGWLSVLILGCVYGITLEALILKSSYALEWNDVNFDLYGRWLGINWVWSSMVVLYHTVFSITIPILLVSLIFPNCRSRPWLNRPSFIIFAVIWIAEAILLHHIANPYQAPGVLYWGTFLVVIGLVVLAWKAPRSLRSLPIHLKTKSQEILNPFWFSTIGFTGTFLWAHALGNLRWIGAYPLIIVVTTNIIVPALTWMAFRFAAQNNPWSEMHQFAAAAGALLFLISKAPEYEWNNANRSDDTTGMTLVGIAMSVFLVGLFKHVHKTMDRKRSTKALSQDDGG